MISYNQVARSLDSKLPGAHAESLVHTFIIRLNWYHQPKDTVLGI